MRGIFVNPDALVVGIIRLPYNSRKEKHLASSFSCGGGEPCLDNHPPHATRARISHSRAHRRRVVIVTVSCVPSSEALETLLLLRIIDRAGRHTDTRVARAARGPAVRLYKRPSLCKSATSCSITGTSSGANAF